MPGEIVGTYVLGYSVQVPEHPIGGGADFAPGNSIKEGTGHPALRSRSKVPMPSIVLRQCLRTSHFFLGHSPSHMEDILSADSVEYIRLSSSSSSSTYLVSCVPT